MASKTATLLLFVSMIAGISCFTAPHEFVTAKQSTIPCFSSKQGHGEKPLMSKVTEAAPKALVTGMVAFMALLGPLELPTGTSQPPPMVRIASADSRIVGELKGSGLVFKDTLEIESFEDPKVKGVTLYISNFQRPLTERLSKDFFSDPSAAALACAKTGPVAIADNIVGGKEGEEVFKESKSLLFKSLRVQRLYDKDKNTMVYVLFNTRLDKSDDSNKSRFKSSLCAVNLDEPSAMPSPAAAP